MASELVIWAHSECRSNAALFAAVKALASRRGVEVTFCLWDVVPMDESRKEHLWEAVHVGDDIGKGRAVIRERGGRDSMHVFCVYQNSAVWRTLILEAKATGARVVVNAEAPCEMCLGFKGLLKRLYYRLVLPFKVGKVARAADLFLNASGHKDIDRLVALGWAGNKIVPFGYASARLASDAPAAVRGNGFRVLHLGSEAPYRSVTTVEKAVAAAGGMELVKTGGALGVDELVAQIRCADVVVACGLCEPWGMRVNDALLEGVPVVVSDGMGAAGLCDEFGCGCIYPRGDADALAAILRRCRDDKAFYSRIKSGAGRAAVELAPERRAVRWLEAVCAS